MCTVRATKMPKTYNSGYSPVVTHLTTNPPVHCLSSAERTGSSVLSVLWSYVKGPGKLIVYIISFVWERWRSPNNGLEVEA
jgi:hypothetical protein